MKKGIALIMLAVVLNACSNQHQANPQSTDNEQAVKKYFEHFNKHEWDQLAQMYTEVAEFKDPSLGAGLVKQTRQQFIEKYKALAQVFPNVQDKVLQTYPSGNHNIIVEFVSSGTAADSSKFELPICTIFTFENGLITKDYTYYDNFEEQK